MKNFGDPVIALISVFLALAGGEIALARFYPIADPFARFKTEDRGRSYVPSSHAPNYSLRVTAETGLPGVQGSSVFSTNNVGFRGDPLVRPKPDEFRIFMVGGSTTECLVLDDAQAINRVLQDELTGRLSRPRPRIHVYNAAKSGDKSYDHVALIGHRLLHLQPDLITVLAGTNDLRAAVYRADYLHFGESRAAQYFLSTLLKFAATEFQIPRRVHALIHRVRPRTERERLEETHLVTDYREKVALSAGRPVADRPPQTDLVPYEGNLRTIIGMTRGHGVQVVLITQPSTWNSKVDPEARKWHWMTYLDGVRYREDLLDSALESYNDVMRRVARETRTPLFDLARAIPKSLEFFYDDAHFNVKGARLVGTRLAEFLVRNELVSDAR